ncbi:MAG: ABC transporter ATP-binding protein [Bacteroidales bacterium]|nr:ABC transporter ATP-binding protein [Bacteroidales bacterium]
MEENIAIRISGLSKKYNLSGKKIGLNFSERLKDIFLKKNKTVIKKESFYALKDINLEIKKGESLGIIGRNGAGKSTFLKILSEVVEPTEGTIEINGSVASVLEVGMGFHPDLTGRENVFLSCAMMGITKKQTQKQFDKIVAFSGVGKFIDQPVKHYSSGMYIRLAFSVVTNIDADILLFDEVLNMGDLSFQMKCTKKIKELVDKKKTVLLVSHNLNDIQQLCSSIICFDNGKLLTNEDSNIIGKYMEDSRTERKEIHEANSSIAKKNAYENILSREWIHEEALGNDKIKLRRIWIENETRKGDKVIFTSDSISINIEYEKFDKSIIDIGITMTSFNNLFLVSALKNTEILDDMNFCGCYVAKVNFPENFFNEIILDIGIEIYLNYKAVIRDHNVIALKIIYTPENKKFYSVYSKHLGPLNPKLDWKLNKKTD